MAPACHWPAHQCVVTTADDGDGGLPTLDLDSWVQYCSARSCGCGVQERRATGTISTSDSTMDVLGRWWWWSEEDMTVSGFMTPHEKRSCPSIRHTACIRCHHSLQRTLGTQLPCLTHPHSAGGLVTWWPCSSVPGRHRSCGPCRLSMHTDRRITRPRRRESLICPCLDSERATLLAQ